MPKDFAIWVRMLRRKSAALQSQLTVWIWLAAKSLTCRLRCCCGPKLALLEQRLNVSNRPAATPGSEEQQ